MTEILLCTKCGTEYVGGQLTKAYNEGRINKYLYDTYTSMNKKLFEEHLQEILKLGYYRLEYPKLIDENKKLINDNDFLQKTINSLPNQLKWAVKIKKYLYKHKAAHANCN